MSIIERLKGWKPGPDTIRLDLEPPAAKALQWWPDTSRAVGYGTGSPLRSTRARLSYAEVDAMFSSAFIACLSTITRALPQAPLEVRRRLEDGTEEPIPNHPLPELYRRPNEDHTATQMWAALLTNYFVSGDAYQQIARDGMKTPRRLYSRPFWTMTPMAPTAKSTRLVDHYEHEVNGKRTRLERDDVLHFRNGIDERAPSYGKCGVSPIESVFGEIFTDDEAASLVSTVMANQGVFTLYTPAGEVDMSDADADAFEARLEAKTTGARRGKAILAQVQLEAKRIGITPEELDYKAVRRIVEERVAAVMCVPAMRAGLGAGLDRSTFQNYEESGAALWEDCLVPLLRDIADVLTAFLLPQYGDASNLFVAFALERVAALQENADAKHKRARENYQGGIVTRNEARAECGRESEGPAGDVYLVPAGMTLVPWQTPPEALASAEEQTAALEQLAAKAAVRGYLAAKADDVAPTAKDWPEARRVLDSLGVEGLGDLLDGEER